MVIDDLYNTSKIILNGAWIGIHNYPETLLKIMKLLKLNSIIHNHTSISWNIKNNEFYVFTDGGRIIRPVFKLYNRKNKIINGDYNEI